MLGGEYQGELVNDLAPKPTLGQTALASFEKPFKQINQLTDYIFPGLSSEESRRKTADRISVINELTNDPRQGLGQSSLNAVSSIAGSLIPTLPLVAAGSAIGAGVAGAIGFGARAIALEAGSDALLSGYIATQAPLANLAEGALSHYLPRFSAGRLGAATLEGYTAYKGMIIPENFSEHYDAVNNTLDASHAIQDWGADNYGFLLGAAPLAAGYIAFKGIRGVIAHRAANASKTALDEELTRLLRQHDEVLKQNEVKAGEIKEKQAKVSELQDHLQQAEDMGMISPEMHEWYLDYLENPNDMTKVHEGGLNVLKALQIPYDRVTGRVWNEVLSRDGIKNMQSALFDEGITQFSPEEQQLLSSYVIHNELDGYIANMRENPNLLNAIQGMTHSHGMRIEAHNNALKAFDHALTRHLPKGLLKRQIFSQNNIFNHLKQFQKDIGRGVTARDIPYTLPSGVLQKLKITEQIRKIEARSTPQYEQKFQNGRHIELKKKLKEMRLTNPAEEMAEIRDKLMPSGKLVSDFKNRKAYHRLEDLSQVWPGAKTVLDRIQMEAINAKQQGLNEILKKFTEMVDTNASSLANPDSVKRYLNSRIENAVPRVREFNQSGINIASGEVKAVEKEAVKQDVLFNESSMNQVKASEYKYARESFEATEKKYKQFSENEQALNDLIVCAYGE
jgi:hypothetical protein